MAIDKLREGSFGMVISDWNMEPMSGLQLLREVRPDEIRDEHLPAATDQLDAIVLHTEEATGAILDAAEAIEAHANKLGDTEITDHVTRIFEACSFQDITGQRIAKVVSTLKHIEARVDALVDVFGDQVRQPQEAAAAPVAKEDMLQGPQLPSEAKNQEEIDALLASMD